MINEQIRDKEVRLIGSDGEQLGIMSAREAQKIADDEGLDLVKISPKANPPVCKILDFGKYRYEMEKKQREAKKNQAVVKIKEVRMQPKIEKHDLETKSKAIAEFLADGNKVKVSVRFRGRELAHPEFGKMVLDKILETLTENGVSYNLDKGALMEGKMMSMTVSPARK